MLQGSPRHALVVRVSCCCLQLKLLATAPATDQPVATQHLGAAKRPGEAWWRASPDACFSLSAHIAQQRVLAEIPRATSVRSRPWPVCLQGDVRQRQTRGWRSRSTAHASKRGGQGMGPENGSTEVLGRSSTPASLGRSGWAQTATRAAPAPACTEAPHPRPAPPGTAGTEPRSVEKAAGRQPLIRLARETRWQLAPRFGLVVVELAIQHQASACAKRNRPLHGRMSAASASR